MSQVTEQSVRFQTALASIKLIQASAVLDLTEDDFDFLTSNKVWIATDRSRARRCVEACVYGTLDRKSGSAGMPRPISYAVFCLKKKNGRRTASAQRTAPRKGGVARPRARDRRPLPDRGGGRRVAGRSR